MSSTNAAPSRCAVGRRTGTGACSLLVLVGGAVGDLVLRGGERQQRPLQHLPHQQRHREGPLDPAVPVLAHPEHRRLLSLALLAVELLGLPRLGHLGCDDLEDPAAQHPQRLGVVDLRERDQRLRRLLQHRGVQVVGQLVQRRADHRRLLRDHVAATQRLPHHVVPIETTREAHLAERLPLRRPRRVGVPHRHRRRRIRLRHRHGLGVRQESASAARPPSPRARAISTNASAVAAWPIDHSGTSATSSSSRVHPRDSPADGVRRGGGHE